MVDEYENRIRLTRVYGEEIPEALLRRLPTGVHVPIGRCAFCRWPVFLMPHAIPGAPRTPICHPCAASYAASAGVGILGMDGLSTKIIRHRTF